MRAAALLVGLLCFGGAAEAGPLPGPSPTSSGSVPAAALPAASAEVPSVLLKSVIVTGKALPEPDESLHAAREAVARFGQQKLPKDPPSFLGFSLEPPVRNNDPNDKAEHLAQHGLAQAGCTGCSIPDNQNP